MSRKRKTEMINPWPARLSSFYRIFGHSCMISLVFLSGDSMSALKVKRKSRIREMRWRDADFEPLTLLTSRGEGSNREDAILTLAIK